MIQTMLQFFMYVKNTLNFSVLIYNSPINTPINLKRYYQKSTKAIALCEHAVSTVLNKIKGCIKMEYSPLKQYVFGCSCCNCSGAQTGRNL